MNTPHSVEKLLNSEDYGDRLRAVNQMRGLEDGIAFELLKKAIQDRNTRVRYAAVSQIADKGTVNKEESLELLRDRLLHDPEIDVQAAAADALGALKLTQAFDDIQTVYQNTNEWLVKVSIVAALGGMGEPRALDILLDALKSDNELLQTIAIGALGELGNREAVPYLIPFVPNPDWQMRYRVAQALKLMGGPEAETALATLAQDEVEQVANEAKS
jgi:HEAT repeat protein